MYGEATPQRRYGRHNRSGSGGHVARSGVRGNGDGERVEREQVQQRVADVAVEPARGGLVFRHVEALNKEED